MTSCWAYLNKTVGIDKSFGSLLSCWTVKLDKSVTLRVKCQNSTLASDGQNNVNRHKEYNIATRRIWSGAKKSSAWGWDKFIEWDQLVSSKFLASDGSITLEVEFPASVQMVTTF